ncbi:MAG: RNA polymerase subunit sigma-24 [Planctomycetes bacterium]|nr:RNA polymerase subunit sigma-24 [Planctomycetota bacterium]
MTDASFQATVDAARNGDEEAAARLVREYQPELQRYIRFRLTNPGLRRFLDSLDVCQSVLAAFFVHLKGGRLEMIQPRQLFRFLAVMAENKVRDKARRHRTARRGAGILDGSPSIETVDLSSADPGPAELASDRDLVAALRDRLPAEDRDSVERWLAGDGWNEIAAAAGNTPEAVRKQVTRSIDRAAKELGLIETSP